MGGMAFKNVGRIKKSQISGTLKWLDNQNIGLTYYYMTNHLLGSTGKKETSGDIDLNIDQNKFNHSDLIKALSNVVSSENVKSKPDLVMASVPIKGNAEKFGRVQVDFMIGNVKWQEFAYWAPKYERIKGVYRTILLKALTLYTSDWVLEENNEVIARVGPTFYLNKGCIWRYRYRPFNRVTKTTRIKDFIELTEKEFLDIYPSAFTISNTHITDPDEFCTFIDHYMSVIICDTYIGLAKFIQNNYSYEQTKRIGRIYINLLNKSNVEILPIIRAHFRLD